MENLSNNNKKRLNIVAIPLDQELHDMLVVFAKKEQRAKSNAALILLRDSLLKLMEDNYDRR